MRRAFVIFAFVIGVACGPMHAQSSDVSQTGAPVVSAQEFDPSYPTLQEQEQMFGPMTRVPGAPTSGGFLAGWLLNVCCTFLLLLGAFYGGRAAWRQMSTRLDSEEDLSGFAEPQPRPSVLPPAPPAPAAPPRERPKPGFGRRI